MSFHPPVSTGADTFKPVPRGVRVHSLQSMFPNPIPPQTSTPKQQPRPPAALHIPQKNKLILPRKEDSIPPTTMLPVLQPTAYHTPDLK